MVYWADMRLVSTITCPACGHQAAETMPTNACLISYDCKGCGVRLTPGGQCFVFCSYGSVPCLPMQPDHARRRVNKMQREEAMASYYVRLLSRGDAWPLVVVILLTGDDARGVTIRLIA